MAKLDREIAGYQSLLDLYKSGEVSFSVGGVDVTAAEIESLQADIAGCLYLKSILVTGAHRT